MSSKKTESQTIGTPTRVMLRCEECSGKRWATMAYTVDANGDLDREITCGNCGTRTVEPLPTSSDLYRRLTQRAA